MELEFERNAMTYYDSVAKLSVCQEETLESIVPDACADILRIVDVCAQATLSAKQAKEGMAVVSGMVRACILYQPDNAMQTCRMELSIPFTCQADAPELTQQGYVQASTRVRCADARTLNPRKVLVRFDLVTDIEVCQPVQLPVCCAVVEAQQNAICQRQFQGESYRLRAVQEKPFTFSEQVKLPQTQGEPAQVMVVRALPVCTESKLIGNKMIFKGNIELNILLQDAQGMLNACHETLPFSQIMEIVEVNDGADARVSVDLADIQYNADMGDGRSIDIILDLLAQAQVYANEGVTLLEDLYSTQFYTEVDTQTQQLPQLGEQGVRAQMVRELIETGEMVHSVVESNVVLGETTQTREGAQMVLCAACCVSVLYLDENNQIQCVRRTLPASIRIDCPEQHQCSFTVKNMGDIFATPSAGGIEVRFSVEFEYICTSLQILAGVKGARLGETRAQAEGNRPSVVLRLAASGEGIWELAKTYGTTKEQILQANELTDELLPAQRLLLIPRTR